MRFTYSFIAVVFGFIAVAGDASAQRQTAEVLGDWDAADIQPLLTNLSISVVGQGAHDDGTPYLEVTTEGGIRFRIDGTVCENNRCRGMRMVAYFELPQGQTFEQVRQRLNYATVAVRETADGRFFIMRYVILDNGVTPANLETNIYVFADAGTRILERLNNGT